MKLTTGQLDLGDGVLVYDIAGADGPDLQRETVVLSHAGFLDSRMWDAQLDALSQRFRVVRYDMIGYGRSSPARGPRCRREDLRRLLAHLGVTRAHLVGCSMGGALSLDLALEHPNLATSLTLVNSAPSGFEPQGAPPRYVFEMLGALQAGDIDAASEFQLRIWVDGPTREPDQINAAVRARAAEMNHICVAQNTFVLADLQPLNPLRPPAMSRLGEVRAPTLVISGLLDDAGALRASALLAAGIPGARHVEIPGAAHVPGLERPEAVNAALMGFYRQVTDRCSPA
jgi:pimeloyl-ACP methyl ester carboxylesterase